MGVVAKEKKVDFFTREVFFFLTCPLMGDPIDIDYRFETPELK